MKLEESVTAREKAGLETVCRTGAEKV